MIVLGLAYLRRYYCMFTVKSVVIFSPFHWSSTTMTFPATDVHLYPIFLHRSPFILHSKLKGF